jgi:hypothetical protein
MGYEGANKMNNCLMMATSLSNDTTTSLKEKERCTDKILYALLYTHQPLLVLLYPFPLIVTL